MDLSENTTSLQGLEAEIERVKAAIQSLREKQRHLQSLRNLKLPFFHLPPEICVAIFSFACHKGRLPNDQNQEVVTTPFTISGVCHAWRELAHSAPELWSSASLCVGSIRSTRSMVQAELFRRWLHLAKTLPLSISITFDERVASDTWKPSGRQTAISVAASYSHQWESVDLTLPSDLLLSIGCKPFPNLQSLSLKIPRQNSIAPLPIFLDAPKLRAANLDCANIDVGLPYHQLEELTLHGYDIAPCLSLLDKSSNLTFCRIVKVLEPIGFHWGRPAEDISHRLTKPVHLLKLVSLETTDSEPFKLLACIKAPALRSIAIPLRDVHQMKALSTFLTRSNAMLQRLTIIDHIPEEEEFLKMLDTLSHLSHLEINEVRTLGSRRFGFRSDSPLVWLGPSQKFFDYLTTPDATLDNLPLPALTSFKYHGPINFKSDNRLTEQWDDKYQFDIDSLEKMLVSRWNANISFNSTSQLQSFIMSIQSPHGAVAHLEQSPVVQKLRKEGMHLVFELAEEQSKKPSSFYI